jgi:hypothetical protein
MGSYAPVKTRHIFYSGVVKQSHVLWKDSLNSDFTNINKKEPHLISIYFEAIKTTTYGIAKFYSRGNKFCTLNLQLILEMWYELS